MPLKYFKHMKTYDGIMESSFMFFMQVPTDKSTRSDQLITTLVDGDLQFDPNWPERSSAFHRRCKV